MDSEVARALVFSGLSCSCHDQDQEDLCKEKFRILRKWLKYNAVFK